MSSTPVPASPGTPTPDSGDGGPRKQWWRSPLVLSLIAGAVVLAVVLAVAFSSGTTPAKKAATGEVLLEGAASTGPDPFTASVASPVPTISAAPPSFAPVSSPTTGPAPVVVRVETGNTVGLYGGTLNISQCDAGQMARYLAENPSKASAWIQALNSDPLLRWSGGTSVSTAQINDYLAQLTPVILRADTRVTNNGFFNGQPTPRQSILQTGTAVLVDTYGVPRARCACGNPLSPPQPVSGTVTYTGSPWPNFSPTTVVVVNPSTTVINTFVLVNINNGTTINQPVGNKPATQPTQPTAPPTSAPPLTAAPPPTTVAPPPTAPPTTIPGRSSAPLPPVTAPTTIASPPPHSDFDVTSISPSAAPASGGTTLTLTGYGFLSHGGLSIVEFQSVGGYLTDSGTWKVVSDTKITYKMDPASSNGGCNQGCTTDLLIAFNDKNFGRTGITGAVGEVAVPLSAPSFIITPPLPPPTTTTTRPTVGVTAMSPNSGPPTGGTTATVTGFGFTTHGGIEALDLEDSSGYEAAPASFTLDSDTQLTIKIGPATSNGGCDKGCTAHLYIAFKDGFQFKGPDFTIG